jgi:hypothetical protein
MESKPPADEPSNVLELPNEEDYCIPECKYECK